MEIVNFGSMNLDYVYTVPDFVRPGETLAVESRAVYCGGKGLNQSVAAARAGAASGSSPASTRMKSTVIQPLSPLNSARSSAVG